ncbi:hypothetical protein AVEN_221755-1 [Araneus ventricosus]|uniref:Uncharacterized protein n=1 Tax=Araneus ventricosus TaxID=182803 RepID=A0A4Y2FMD7_ARAVE|nr:hypothetical protein AVEN_221755-1 [Araneus ventricosus]
MLHEVNANKIQTVSNLLFASSHCNFRLIPHIRFRSNLLNSHPRLLLPLLTSLTTIPPPLLHQAYYSAANKFRPTRNTTTGLFKRSYSVSTPSSKLKYSYTVFLLILFARATDTPSAFLIESVGFRARDDYNQPFLASVLKV